MTARTPKTRAASPPAARGSAVPDADPAGTLKPPARVPAQTPAGGEPTVPSSSPAGSTALSGEEWRKEVKRVTSAQHAEQRRKATRYVPRSRKGVQAASGPGMVRRMPPPRPPEDAA